ncbi:MAG: LysM peptidoglycan-binding domain-containing protein [Propionibacteriaceae bacterium]|nr:LysM peptidoglycan-binding domain-containing protein [Propionibacteriaceae bacterium]
MRRLLALIIVVALAIGPPAALLAWGFTDWGAIHLWSVTDVRVLLGGLTVLGWLAWAAWMLGLAIELAVAVSGRRFVLPTPGLGLPRALASTLITMMLSGTALTAQASEPLPPPLATPLVPATVVELADVREPDAPAEVHDAPEAEVNHTVTAGDDLWSLAQHYYGEGARWRTIVAANPSLGADPTARLVPGTTLAIPEPAESVTVTEGDTLSGLARDHLGEADRWPELHDLNRDTIADPDLIHPGWVLALPAPSTSPAESVDAEPIDDEPEVAESAEEPSLEVVLPEAVPPALSPTGGTPASTPTVAVARLAPDGDAAPASRLLGGLSALSAAAVLGGLGVRRHLQAVQRPLGRRYAAPDATDARYEVALRQMAHPEEAPEQAPDRPLLLDRAQRHLARHWWQSGTPAPRLERVVVTAQDVTFHCTDATSAPPGFVLVGDAIAISWAGASALDDVDHPVAYPALVTLGEVEEGSLLLVDALAAGVLGIRDDGQGGAQEVLSGLLVELSCARWSAELDLVAVTEDPAFVDATGEGRIVALADTEEGVRTVERLVDQRSRFLDAGAWDAGRLDPDLAEAWSVQVVVFETLPDAEQIARLEDATARGCGVAAITVLPPGADQQHDWALTRDATGHRSVTAGTVRATPQTVPSATRGALAALHERTNDTTGEPAPWWETPGEDPVNIIALHPAPEPVATAGPWVGLLGPIELHGCAGEPPARAVRQCLEYAAWLHLNPGSTPAQMMSALMVADGTRRSNMSRLRTWLGRRPDGALYLPDAYSGRITLDPAITSDWERLSLLVTGGVARLPLERLVAALELVRGAPLADAAPGQWGWAEEFRSDATALIRDLGVLAARKAREAGDLELSRWAAHRGLVAAPDDELLLVERLRTEHAAGRLDEVERLAHRVVRTARTLGLDLLPETVDALQDVVEGRLRARA